METEEKVSEELSKFFDGQGWEYRKEWVTKSGKAIDYLVKAPYDEGHIFFGVECKKDFNEKTNITILADHLEQANAYSKDLDMPVFLATFHTKKSASGMYQGGTEVQAIQALMVFGGRVNVGGIFRQTRYVGQCDYLNRWFFILRGSVFWDDRTGFNEKRLNMVNSTGSAKERKALKIWKS